jgi:hypothetical protein
MAEKPEKPTPTKPVLTLDDAAVLVGVDVTDCLAFKDYGDSVVIVTVDGQKLQANKNEKA